MADVDAYVGCITDVASGLIADLSRYIRQGRVYRYMHWNEPEKWMENVCYATSYKKFCTTALPVIPLDKLPDTITPNALDLPACYDSEHCGSPVGYLKSLDPLTGRMVDHRGGDLIYPYEFEIAFYDVIEYPHPYLKCYIECTYVLDLDEPENISVIRYEGNNSYMDAVITGFTSFGGFQVRRITDYADPDILKPLVTVMSLAECGSIYAMILAAYVADVVTYRALHISTSALIEDLRDDVKWALEYGKGLSDLTGNYDYYMLKVRRNAEQVYTSILLPPWRREELEPEIIAYADKIYTKLMKCMENAGLPKGEAYMPALSLPLTSYVAALMRHGFSEQEARLILHWAGWSDIESAITDFLVKYRGYPRSFARREAIRIMLSEGWL